MEEKMNAYIEMVAFSQAKLIDEYVELHVKKPDNMPMWLFKYFMRKCVQLQHFRK